MRNQTVKEIPSKFDQPVHAILSQVEWTEIGAQLTMSSRELEVVQMIFDGCIEYQIARELDISIHTVHTYIKRVYAKLNIHDQRELIVKVFSAYISLRAVNDDPSAGDTLTGGLMSAGELFQ